MNIRHAVHIALLAFAAGAAAPALAQIEIKFGHVGEPNSLFAASAEDAVRRARLDLLVALGRFPR